MTLYDAEKTYKKIVRGTKKYFENAGFKKAKKQSSD